MAAFHAFRIHKLFLSEQPLWHNHVFLSFGKFITFTFGSRLKIQNMSNLSWNRHIPHRKINKRRISQLIGKTYIYIVQMDNWFGRQSQFILWHSVYLLVPWSINALFFMKHRYNSKFLFQTATLNCPSFIQCKLFLFFFFFLCQVSISRFFFSVLHIFQCCTSIAYFAVTFIISVGKISNLCPSVWQDALWEVISILFVERRTLKSRTTGCKHWVIL